MTISDKYSDLVKYFLNPISAVDSDSPLKLVFTGANGLLFDDGESKVYIDPYLSRFSNLLGPAFLFRKFRPNEEKIDRHLKALSVDSIDAVLLTHTHPDHAIDAPYIARKSNAMLYGSDSAKKIAKGWKIEKYRQMSNNDTAKAGDFNFRFIRSRHQPFHFLLKPFSGLGKDIEKLIGVEAKASEFKAGKYYAIELIHDKIKILINGSPGYIEGMFDDINADIVITAVAGLAMQSRKYFETFFNEVIIKTGAKKVLLSHWDDFRKDLSNKQSFINRCHKPAKKIIELGDKHGIDTWILPIMQPFAIEKLF